MNHTIQSAMERGELTEEEAFFVLRFAGRMGYDKAIKRLRPNLFKNVRRWLFWVGGWEHPELMQWDRGAKAWEPFRFLDGKRELRDMTPITLLGRFITIQNFGVAIRIGRGYLCFNAATRKGKKDKLYWSPNSTPHHPKAKILWQRGPLVTKPT